MKVLYFIIFDRNKDKKLEYLKYFTDVALEFTSRIKGEDEKFVLYNRDGVMRLEKYTLFHTEKDILILYYKELEENYSIYETIFLNYRSVENINDLDYLEDLFKNKYTEKMSSYSIIFNTIGIKLEFKDGKIKEFEINNLIKHCYNVDNIIRKYIYELEKLNHRKINIYDKQTLELNKKELFELQNGEEIIAILLLILSGNEIKNFLTENYLKYLTKNELQELF